MYYYVLLQLLLNMYMYIYIYMFVWLICTLSTLSLDYLVIHTVPKLLKSGSSKASKYVYFSILGLQTRIQPYQYTWACIFSITSFLFCLFLSALKPISTVTLSSMYGTPHTLKTGLWPWSCTLVKFLHLQHKSLYSFLLLTHPPATDFSSITPSSFLLFYLLPSLSLSYALSPLWWVIKVVRAILLPRGWETYSKAAEIKMKTN